MKPSIAFTSPFARVIVDNKSIRSLEFTVLKEKLETIGNEVFAVSKLTRKESGLNYYTNLMNLSDKKFDNIIIHNYNANIFGGLVTNLTIEYIRFVTNNSTCRFFYYITDPKLKYFNVPKFLLSRSNLKYETTISIEELHFHAKKHEDIENRMEAIFTGYNYKHIYGADFVRVLNLKIFSNLIDNSTLKFKGKQDSEIEYDICYFGDNRGTYRNNKLKKFLDSNLINSLLIGLEIPLKGATFIDKVSNQELKPLVQKCLSSLVIGDAEHENAFITARFYENISFNVVSFIDLQYDLEKKLFKNPVLQEFNYIIDQQDLINKVERLKQNSDFRFEIIRLQKEELKTNSLLC